MVLSVALFKPFDASNPPPRSTSPRPSTPVFRKKNKRKKKKKTRRPWRSPCRAAPLPRSTGREGHTPRGAPAVRSMYSDPTKQPVPAKPQRGDPYRVTVLGWRSKVRSLKVRCLWDPFWIPRLILDGKSVTLSETSAINSTKTN